MIPNLQSRFGSVALLLLLAPIAAGITVNPPIPITNSVTIQSYRAVKSNGTKAVFMGNEASEAYIKQQIDVILSQVGISAIWLPPIEVVDDFLYEGNPSQYGSGQRPSGEFNTVVNSQSAPRGQLKMYFVEVVPAYTHLDDWNVNGYAWIDRTGAVMHVGANLLSTSDHRDIVASVIAHEICHNLGLDHVGDSDNLMSGGANTSDRLTSAQKNTIFTNNQGVDGYDLLEVYTVPTNYGTWARNLGLTESPVGDDDLDGLANVLEFMLDLDGSVPDSHTMPLPTSSPSGLVWTIQKKSEALDDGLIYCIEVSSNLSSGWLDAGAAGSTVLTDNATTYSVRLDNGSAGKFMRIKADLTSTALGGSRSATPSEVQAKPKTAAAAGSPYKKATDADYMGRGYRATGRPQ